MLQHRRWRGLVAGGATLVLLTTFGQSETGAQTFEIQVTPASGPPGTTITVSGTGCPPDAILLQDPELDTDEHAQAWFVDLDANEAIVSEFFTAPLAGADGAWSVDVVVPDVPLGTVLGIRTQCTGDSAFTVGSASFGVEAVQPPPPTTATTSPPSAPPPPPAPPAASTPPAASASLPASGSGSGAATGGDLGSAAIAPVATPVLDAQPSFTG
jgi:hypothetical protein